MARMLRQKPSCLWQFNDSLGLLVNKGENTVYAQYQTVVLGATIWGRGAGGLRCVNQQIHVPTFFEAGKCLKPPK